MNTVVTRLFLPADESGQWEAAPDLPLLALLLSELHRGADGGTFAVGFPAWQDPGATTLGTFGRTCDVFAPARDGLSAMLDAPKVRRLVRDHCVATPIRPIPEDQVAGYAEFHRCRRHDRVSPAAIRRMLQPEQAVAKPESLTGRVRTLAAEGLSISMIRERLDACPTGPHFHYRTTHTALSAQLVIRRRLTDAPGPLAFTSFGFSRGGAVPVIDLAWGR